MSNVSKKHGFTLIELLIVMAVLLILATVGLSNFTFTLKKSHDTQRKSDLATIAKGLEAFAADFGVYPESSEGNIIACDYNNTGLIACNWGSPMTAFFPYSEQAANRNDVTYLAKLPRDPTSGQEYYYEQTASGFNLYAGLENESDPRYQADLGVNCGDVECNYLVTETGVQ